MDVAYVFRIIVALLAAGIVGLCFTKVIWVSANAVRNYRVIGLGFLCSAIAWGTTARRGEDFKPWLIPLLVGLIITAYGMAREAPYEKSKVKVKSTESP